MNAFEQIITGIENTANHNVSVNDCDYYSNGLLYCGKCNTPKQARIEIFGTIRTPMCLCACEFKKEQDEEKAIKEEQKNRTIKEMKVDCFPESDMFNWTFSNDDTPEDKISLICRNYIDNFDAMNESGKGLLLFGSVGCGKSFHSACIVNALIEKGYRCLFTSLSTIVNTISSVSDRQGYIDSLSRYTMIVIDDVGTERNTEYMNEIVEQIIDRRCQSKKPVIVTTNLTAEQLKSPSDITKKRLYSRLLEMCIPVECVGKDRRRQKLVDDYSKYKKMLGL